MRRHSAVQLADVCERVLTPVLLHFVPFVKEEAVVRSRVQPGLAQSGSGEAEGRSVQEEEMGIALLVAALTFVGVFNSDPQFVGRV